ncbi:MAG TPA: YceI family protein [Terriglobia bacterium]|nr:YceI family protein [Terriglobia bacterium]
MKNHRVGFHFFLGSHSTQVRTVAALTQDKYYSPPDAFAVRGGCLRCLLVLALLLAGSELLSAQVSGAYRVNSKESRIEIHLFKGGFLSALGDNHLIALTRFSGMAHLSELDGWNAELSGDAGSLKVVDPWGEPSERKEVEDTMLGPTQLDVHNFPSIKLHSVSFDPTDQDTAWHLLAEVELHGVTRKVQFSLDCKEIGDKLHIRGKKMFKLTDFNIQPFSTAFGAIKVKNDFEVTYNVVLERIP